MKNLFKYKSIVIVALTFLMQNTQAQINYTYDELGNRIERYELKSAQIVQDSVDATEPVIFAEVEDNPLEEPIFTNEFDKNTVKVYPNPTRGAVNVRFNSLPEGSPSLAVFDSGGTLVSQELISSANTRVNLAFQPNGIYLIVIKQGDATLFWKIIKN